MFDEYEKNKREHISGRRSLMDIGVGIMIVAVGVFIVFNKKLIDLPYSWMNSFFAIMWILYGSWRIYRGYKKNYFK